MDKKTAVLELLRLALEEHRYNRDFKKLGRALDTLGIFDNVERVAIAHAFNYCDAWGAPYAAKGPGVAAIFWTPLVKDEQEGA